MESLVFGGQNNPRVLTPNNMYLSYTHPVADITICSDLKSEEPTDTPRSVPRLLLNCNFLNRQA